MWRDLEWLSNAWNVEQPGCTIDVLLEGTKIKMLKQKLSAQTFGLPMEISVKRFHED